jgi:hypothetical protein
VDVCRPHGVSVHHLQQIERRPVGRQRIGRWVVAVERVLAVLVGSELATQVVGALVVGVLEIVFSVGRGLPDIENGAGDGLASDQIANNSVHQNHTAILGRILDDGGAVIAERGIGRPEGSQDGR